MWIPDLRRNKKPTVQALPESPRRLFSHLGTYIRAFATPTKKSPSTDSGGKKSSYCRVHLFTIVLPWTSTLLVPEKQTIIWEVANFTPYAQPKSILKFNVVIFSVCSRCHIRAHDTTVHLHPVRDAQTHLHHLHVHSTRLLLTTGCSPCLPRLHVHSTWPFHATGCSPCLPHLHVRTTWPYPATGCPPVCRQPSTTTTGAQTPSRSLQEVR